MTCICTFINPFLIKLFPIHHCLKKACPAASMARIQLLMFVYSGTIFRTYKSVFVSCVTSQGMSRVSHVSRMRIISEYNELEESNLHNDYIVLKNYMKMRLFITSDNMKIYWILDSTCRCSELKAGIHLNITTTSELK